MSYRFKLDESLAEGARRIIIEQIERALEEISSRADQAVAVHETRKCLKRIRALLKLVRPMLATDAYKAENGRFRDIAKGLSETRDRDVLHQTLLTLQSCGDDMQNKILKDVRKCVPALDRIIERAPSAALAEAAAALKTARRQYRRLDFASTEETRLFEGLKASYKAARKSRDLAYGAGDDEAFHEWRKPVQVHWRQMRLLIDAWPEAVSVRIEAARELSQMLGEDHDLSVLLAFAENLAKEGRLSKSSASATVAMAKERQHDLRRRAEPIGRRLFAESPSAHAERMEALWASACRVDAKLARPARQTAKRRPVPTAS